MYEIFSLTNVMDRISSKHQMGLIRQAVFQKEETLKHIKSDIEQLQMEREALEMDLIHYKNAVSPQNRIPDDVLMEIFILIAEEHGCVRLPLEKEPIQLVLLRVCSCWRKVALHTSKLWNSVHVSGSNYVYNIMQLDKWTLRAGQSPVTISVELEEATYFMQDMVSLFKVKKLHLKLNFSRFMALQDTVLPDIEKLALQFHESCNRKSFDMPHTLPRLRSVAFEFYNGHSEVLGQLSLPWSQLQCVNFGSCKLVTVIDILRQVPMLRELSMKLNDDNFFGPFQALTMPCLQTIDINFKSGMNIDATLRLFTCPALTKLWLATWFRFDGLPLPYTICTREIYDTVKQQYNVHGLQEMPKLSFPASCILKDASLLQTLSLPYGATVDDEAIMGIANGTLGRNLRELRIDASCDFDEVLGMVEARKRMVDGLLDSGCIWREMITVLKRVEMSYVKESAILGEHRRVYKERICALKEAGITISLPCQYDAYFRLM